MRYSFAVLSKFARAISNFQNKLLFLCLFRSRNGNGWLIFSMLDVLFSRRVFIHLSLHETKAKVLWMPSPEMQKWIYFMLSNNKFLGKCWYGRHLWIRLAMESESMVEKGINFISVWEPPMAYLAWKVFGTLRRFRWWDGYTSQNVFISIFRFELWHLYKSLLPSTKVLSLTLCNFYFWIWVSILSYKSTN